jgi:hypothetical protein
MLMVSVFSVFGGVGGSFSGNDSESVKKYYCCFGAEF